MMRHRASSDTTALMSLQSSAQNTDEAASLSHDPALALIGAGASPTTGDPSRYSFKFRTRSGLDAPGSPAESSSPAPPVLLGTREQEQQDDGDFFGLGSSPSLFKHGMVRQMSMPSPKRHTLTSLSMARPRSPRHAGRSSPSGAANANPKSRPIGAPMISNTQAFDVMQSVRNATGPTTAAPKLGAPTVVNAVNVTSVHANPQPNPRPKHRMPLVPEWKAMQALRSVQSGVNLSAALTAAAKSQGVQRATAPTPPELGPGHDPDSNSAPIPPPSPINADEGDSRQRSLQVKGFGDPLASSGIGSERCYGGRSPPPMLSPPPPPPPPLPSPLAISPPGFDNEYKFSEASPASAAAPMCDLSPISDTMATLFPNAALAQQALERRETMSSSTTLSPRSRGASEGSPNDSERRLHQQIQDRVLVARRRSSRMRRSRRGTESERYRQGVNTLSSGHGYSSYGDANENDSLDPETSSANRHRTPDCQVSLNRQLEPASAPSDLDGYDTEHSDYFDSSGPPSLRSSRDSVRSAITDDVVTQINDFEVMRIAAMEQLPAPAGDASDAAHSSPIEGEGHGLG
uniref:Uncharacterized protein n=2 Tax=Phaeomonas parva TaxID=124430 RepID=A0A6U4L6I0_9STRA|mmetsp:Transcript_8300/g.23717  ORF Transcript_8300/g.23717 Transcript_8300/m.23717 type:complete len:574 (+) Transcript_8300:398-2119(+)